MIILFILFLVSLFLGLILLAARRINRSETVEMINQSICLSAGVQRRD
jgi:hypothetical protein